MTYLKNTDDGAFEDYPLIDPLKAYEMGMILDCPKCKGHGGWNLKLNAYPLHGRPNTPENRHLFSHFRAACDHCNGWGHVLPGDEDHIHEWEYIKNIGNCLNLYRCKVCNRDWEIDSSD